MYCPSGTLNLLNIKAKDALESAQVTASAAAGPTGNKARYAEGQSKNTQDSQAQAGGWNQGSFHADL